MVDIPEEATKPSEEPAQIPEKVASAPQEEAPEVKPYLISFSKYNEDMCEIEHLDKNKAKRTVETFKTIGTKIRSQADFQRFSIDRIPVKNAGEYKKLFRGLGEDIDLKELKLQQDARIFYFDVEPERMFYVVAITQNHLETDKVRR